MNTKIDYIKYFFILKVVFYRSCRYLYNMKTKGKITKKKISITVDTKLLEVMDKDLTNKSALINKLLSEHYANKGV